MDKFNNWREKPLPAKSLHSNRMHISISSTQVPLQFRLSCPPSPLHYPGTSPDLTPPAMWCGGWQALFDLISGLGVKWGWMDAWVGGCRWGAPPEI
ncbi:MAG TPA: hypothetical protein VMW20_00675 [Candidatus Nanoarchaeia archaeon]|nr:hypothetical protein [Candidatus Nanoarchaeia archaeon]